MTPRQCAIRAGLLGFIIPAICEAAFYIHPYIPGPWVYWIWPSSIFLGILQFNLPPYEVAITITVSVALNVILYTGAGWAAGLLNSRRLRIRAQSS